MSKIMYKIGVRQWSEPRIDSVEIVRETEHFVWNKLGYREAKRTQYDEYHETSEAAYSSLLAYAESNIAGAEKELQRKKDRLTKIMELKP